MWPGCRTTRSRPTPMFELGQTEKNSVRAYVFRFALKFGHTSMRSACLRRASNGLMRCSKQPPYSITLSAWPSNEGGLDSALAFRRQLDGQICRLFPHSTLLYVSQRPALIFTGPHGRPLASARSGAMTRHCGDRQLCCKLLPVQPLHKHYVDAAGNPNQ